MVLTEFLYNLKIDEMDVDGMGLWDCVDDEPILNSPYFGALTGSQLEDRLEVDGESGL